MYKKILVPYDKSDPAKNALGAALDLAAGVPGASFNVLPVNVSVAPSHTGCFSPGCLPLT